MKNKTKLGIMFGLCFGVVNSSMCTAFGRAARLASADTVYSAASAMSWAGKVSTETAYKAYETVPPLLKLGGKCFTSTSRVFLAESTTKVKKPDLNDLILSTCFCGITANALIISGILYKPAMATVAIASSVPVVPILAGIGAATFAYHLRDRLEDERVNNEIQTKLFWSRYKRAS